MLAMSCLIVTRWMQQCLPSRIDMTMFSEKRHFLLCIFKGRKLLLKDSLSDLARIGLHTFH